MHAAAAARLETITRGDDARWPAALLRLALERARGWVSFLGIITTVAGNGTAAYAGDNGDALAASPSYFALPRT